MRTSAHGWRRPSWLATLHGRREAGARIDLPPPAGYSAGMFLLLLLAACAPHATTPAAATGDLGAPNAILPLDPEVRTGTLANGLTWYVEPNGYPDARAELRLVVSVGSVVEDEDQRGLAHVLEHMAFNGSKSFPEGELVKWFESVGMTFGAHLNAYTSFDETVYTVTVPTDDPAVLDKGLLVLREWADGLTLGDMAIERERGVVLEEWRTGLGAQDRIFKALAPLYYQGSPYAERLPIGTEASLRTFTPDAVRRFYEDWYRPDRMAVIAVGDFDAATVESAIQTRFADLSGPNPPRGRPNFTIPEHLEPLVGIVTDPEVTDAWVSVTAKVDDAEDRTYGGYRTKLVEDLTTDVLNERFSTLADGADTPIGGAGGGFSRWNATEGAWSVGASVRDGEALAALRIVLTEVERLRRHGVTEAELERARARSKQSYDAYWRGRDEEPSTEAAEELIRAFLTGETVPGVALEVEMAKRWLPTITREEIAAFAKSWMPVTSRVVEVGMPAQGATPPTEAEVRALIDEVRSAPIDPPVEEAADAPLLDPLPTPGKVTARGAVPELGVTTWTLSNGVEVWVKPTDFSAGEVLLGAWSPGGEAMVPDTQWIAARSAEALRSLSGLGALDRAALDRRLAGRDANAWVNIGRYEENVHGKATAEDLEAMFQLLHLQFTQPRFDAEAMVRYRADTAENIARRANNPNNLFSDAVIDASWQGHPRTRAWKPSDLDALDLATSEAFRKARFANAADFRFLIVGDVDLAKLEPLVARYIGSLPTSAQRDTFVDDGARLPDAPVTREVIAGTDPKARVSLSFHGPYEGGWLARNRLGALSHVLEVRLREELREERGGVYGVSVNEDTWTVPVLSYRLTIAFTCDPARKDELLAAARAVIDEVRAGPVAESYIESQKVSARRDREERVRTNAFWKSTILGAIERGEDPRDLLGWDARNDSLTAAELHTAARDWLDPARTILVELEPLPATTEDPTGAVRP